MEHVTAAKSRMLNSAKVLKGIELVWNRYVVVFLLLILANGCGSGGINKADMQSTQESAEKAIELEKSGKYAEALPLIDVAISKGGLNPDQLAEAYLLRARCHCAKGSLELAEADLASAELGSPNPASWHFSRAILFAKQKKIAESKSELAKAQRIDPKLKMPD
jgi:tetratricopeptide (TPR) repeat protein